MALRQTVSLNPYSNGILTDSKVMTISDEDIAVLILILMEYSLTVGYQYCKNNTDCLNPYSNGILTDMKTRVELFGTSVLILILMEYSLTLEYRNTTTSYA